MKPPTGPHGCLDCTTGFFVSNEACSPLSRSL